jgi:beta-phosphoglucomutase-like phosphatase (HAD superfamily)
VTADELTASERAELEALRARVAALEEERAREVAGAMTALARAQERAYWLDRWHIDLNRWAGTRTGSSVRAAMRVLRAPVRAVRLLSRRLRR